MADPHPYPAASDDAHKGDGESPPGAPRWVKAFGIAVLVLVLLAVIIMKMGIGGEHGPGRHLGGSGGHSPLVALEVHQP